MRLLEVPRLPFPVPRYALAQNCPGPADSFSHPVPISYASSLQSLPLHHLLPLTCLFSVIPLRLLDALPFPKGGYS